MERAKSRAALSLNSGDTLPFFTLGAFGASLVVPCVRSRPVSRTERSGKRCFSLREGNTMDMVDHETLHQNGHAVSHTFFPQHPEILTAIPF